MLSDNKKLIAVIGAIQTGIVSSPTKSSKQI
jgi:hypothetical protein